jgi:hypothetical protein
MVSSAFPITAFFFFGVQLPGLVMEGIDEATRGESLKDDFLGVLALILLSDPPAQQGPVWDERMPGSHFVLLHFCLNQISVVEKAAQTGQY